MDGWRAHTILIVDDDELVRRLLLKLLARLGCESVHQASSAAQAVALLVELRPRVVLTDWSMETSDAGMQVARLAIRERIGVAVISGQPPSLPSDLAQVPWLEKDRLNLDMLERELTLLGSA